MTIQKKREDILVSICFEDYVSNEENDKYLRSLMDEIASVYRYWECILVIDNSDSEKFEHIIKFVKNLRLLRVRDNLLHHRKREVAASEAIGDVVLLGSIIEAQFLSIPDMIDSASKHKAIVIGEQCKQRKSMAVIQMLGITSGYHVSRNDFSTCVYPRTLLNQLLNHHNPPLALRFTPRDNRIPIIKQKSTTNYTYKKSADDWRRRSDYLQKLFVDSAPMALGFIILLSLLVSVVSPLYAFYAVIAWVLVEDVQQGWLTTSLVLSLTTMFLGLSIMGIAMGIQNMNDKLSKNAMDDVIDELSEVDLFGQVSKDLNVEVVSDAMSEVKIDANHGAIKNEIYEQAKDNVNAEVGSRKSVIDQMNVDSNK